MDSCVCTADVSFNTHSSSFLDNHRSQTTVLFLCFLVSTPLKHATSSIPNATLFGEFTCAVLQVKRERTDVFIRYGGSDKEMIGINSG